MPNPKICATLDNTNVYSRRLQTLEQEFESDTTRPNWEYRLIVKYECLSTELLPKGVLHFYFIIIFHWTIIILLLS